MESHQNLPFKVGQLAESKSFLSGFRGAWFRCKIKDIRKKKGNINHVLEYFDFPDEKVRWTKLYQVSRDDKKLYMMVRPRFPSIYCEAQMPETCNISEVIAIVDNVWKVGDLVDWLADGCYWSGRITRVLGEDKVKIKLHDPPAGEGQCYEVSCKALRPSLDWSPEHGWTVPTSLDSDACRYCVRLIQPTDQGSIPETASPHAEVRLHTSDLPQSPLWREPRALESGIGVDPAKGGASFEFSAASVSSQGSAGTSPCPELSSSSSKGTPKQPSICALNEEAQLPCEITNTNLGEVGMVRPSSPDSASTHGSRLSAAAEKPTAARDCCYHDRPSKKMRVSEQDFLNSTFSDTIESSILDIEELVNKIKWLKRVHEFGFRFANAMTPSWKFLEDRAAVARI